LGDDADAGDGPDEEEDEAPAGDADEDDGDSQDGDDSGSRSSGKDAGDWYDLDDGFIDDSELLDAPEEDAGKAKHNGFFINKVRTCVCVCFPPHAQRRGELAPQARVP
jgi:hypothetical protein